MQYEIGQYILDSHNRVLLKKSDGSIISNNDRIIDVLTVLAAESPQVVSRKSLLENIWPNKDVTDWALSRVIADIRKLFEDIGEKDQILKTVHGKGFRLTVPVVVLGGDDQTYPANPASVRALVSASPKSKRGRIILASGAAILVLIALAVFIPPGNDGPNGEGVVSDEEARLSLPGQQPGDAEKIETVPFSDAWSTNGDLAMDFREGVSFSPIASEQRLGYEYPGPVNLNNATLLFDISVSQEYIDSNAALHLYALLLFGNWRGEWDCIIDNNSLSTRTKTFECRLDEPGAIFNIAAGQSIRLGVRTLAQGPITGKVTIHKAQIKHAPSFIDEGWLTSNDLPIIYDGGVQYAPKDGGDRLEFKYDGPENLQGATIVFTVEASQEFIDSGATILPYAELPHAQKPSGSWPGEWGCWTPNSALSPVGSRIQCKLDEPNDIFDLDENESLLIGIKSQRGERPMAGTIKIRNVEIIFP